MTTNELVEKVLADAGVSVKIDFVPWKNGQEKRLSYLVSFSGRGHSFTTPYSMGIGHCHSCKHWNPVDYGCKDSIFHHEKIEEELKTNRYKIFPSLSDVLYCCLGDIRAIDLMEFEEWAKDLGYDPDSRSAEKIFRECESLSKKFRKILGAEVIEKLEELLKDY